MSGCAAKLFAVLAPSADTAAVMCAYGGQLPIVTPFIVGCVGAYTPKRIPTEEKYLAMARRFAVSANHVCQDARTELRGLARNRVFFPSLTIGVLECIWKIFYNRLQFVGPAPCWQTTLTATLIPRQGISLGHERKS